ncbi:hypothetical protein GCM10028814_24730 [Angustibacter aerolatus]
MPELQQTGIEPWLREILRCPSCRADLRDAAGPAGPELVCDAEGLAYRVDDGIPVLLVDEARPVDGRGGGDASERPGAGQGVDA